VLGFVVLFYAKGMRKKADFKVDFGADEQAWDVYTQVDRYVRLMGWSRKYVYLMGLAMIIEKNGDNPQLILSILDYLGRPGQRRVD